MILTRLGNKRRIAAKILPYFPEHTTYIEPFFGAGGMFFSKPQAQYNILNDSDDDVFNLFNVIRSRHQDLFRCLDRIPIHRSLFNEWRGKKETDPVIKAVRFLFLSNFGFLGKPSSMRTGPCNTKTIALRRISETKRQLGKAHLSCLDFRVFLSKHVSKIRTANNAFIYCDPPYLATDNNYKEGFSEEDSFALFEALQNTGIKWAMSEFDHPFIIDQAKKRGLFCYLLGERKNLLNKRMEVLITNYIKK